MSSSYIAHAFVKQTDRRVETTYLVKHVEEHGRLESKEPWSIRQMGVYHKSDGSSGDVFVIINPSLPFRRRLKYVRENGSRPSIRALHAMILSCAMENWRLYISDLEKRYLQMVTELTRLK